jgi:putative oxidoreductase
MIRALGRLLLSGVFIVGGFGAFAQPGGRVNKVEAAGIPNPRQSTILNGAIMMIGGLALATGVAPKLAAATLVASLVPTTFVGHPYWQEEDPGVRANQRIHFLKNLTMIGGLLFVLVDNGEK